MTRAYYNEHDPTAAAWLRELITAGAITDGDVDERSIVVVGADELRGYQRCHFFAGIGGWDYALQLAGWPADQPVWTGSCPCQPWSVAGQSQGADDSRHLWPAWFRLIAECRPPTIFGEQVAGHDGLYWLDLVYADMEGADYAIGAADLCAAGVGAPHIRQRLWFVGIAAGRGREWIGDQSEHVQSLQAGAPTVRMADTERGAAERHGHDVGTAAGGAQGAAQERQRLRADAGDGGIAGGVADNNNTGSLLGTPDGESKEGVEEPSGDDTARRGPDGGLAIHRHQSAGWRDLGPREGDYADPAGASGQLERPGGALQAYADWSRCDWLPCRDNKWRPVEPGTFPLAHGLSGRVGRLRGYGNAIVPPLAARFIRAAADVINLQWAGIVT